MQKPESTFIASVHRHLPKSLHWEKMNNPYRGGTADVWYSGKFDLWVEYKFIPKLPVRVNIEADLSVLQLQWLRGRYGEGRTVAVIIGSPLGGVILNDLAWEQSVTPSTYATLAQTRQDIARWIYLSTNEK